MPNQDQHHLIMAPGVQLDPCDTGHCGRAPRGKFFVLRFQLPMSSVVDGRSLYVQRGQCSTPFQRGSLELA